MVISRQCNLSASYQCNLSSCSQVILPGGVSYAEVGGASAVSKVCVVKVDGASSHSDAWLLLWEDGISVHPVRRHTQQTLRMELSTLSDHGNSLFLLHTSDTSSHLKLYLLLYTSSCWNGLELLINAVQFCCKPL